MASAGLLLEGIGLLSLAFIPQHMNPDWLVPELVVKHWWQTPLHNQRAQLLKLLLLVRGNQRIMVINIPWYL